MNYYNETQDQCALACSQPPKSSKFIYVKQNFVKNQMPQTNGGSMKILINPNFKAGNVHINPNFNKPAIVQSKPNIHINPNMRVLQENRKCYVNPNVFTTTTVSSRNTVLPGTLDASVNVTKPIVPQKTIVSTRTKIVNVPDVPSLKKINNITGQVKPTKKRKSVHSKYKIVKSQETDNSKSSSLTYLTNRYKVDKRPLDVQQKHLTKMYNKMHLNKSIEIVKQRWKLPKCTYLNISGILYKKSPNSLKRSTSFEEKTKQKSSTKIIQSKNKKLITIGGVKYKLNVNNKTLKLLTVQKNINRKFGASDSIKTANSSEICRIVLKNKRKLLIRHTKLQRSPSKMKKCNLPCLFYRKFGRCRGKERGTCSKVHNPDQIIICPRFLQGACINETCLLSHKVSAEKMPTCKFFLEGLCSKEDCPYSHVKINPKADICQDFLQGFCKKAKECEKRHQYLCPEFEKSGTCPKRKCPYPHGSLVRKITISKSKLSINRRRVKSATKFKKDKLSKPNLKQNEAEKNINVRYYVELHDKKDGSSELAEKEIGSIEVASLKERPQLGSLPSFIPLDKS